MEKAIEKMKEINDIANGIVENLSLLTLEGVISFEEGAEIINSINKKQSDWMQNTFKEPEVYEFMKRYII